MAVVLPGAAVPPAAPGPPKAPPASIVSPSFAVMGVQPPASAYIGPDDFLRMSAWSSIAGVIVQYFGRILRPDGQVIPFAYLVAPPATRVGLASVQPLQEGFLLNLMVQVQAGVVEIGQVFAQVQLQRGSVTPAFIYALYALGYITTTQQLAWPTGTIQNSAMGPGVFRSFTGTTPAAGAEISQTVPTAARWLLRGMAVSFTTSAAVANRAPTVIIDDGATILQQYQAAAVQAAGVTRSLLVGATGVIPDATAAVIQIFSQPSIPMLPGWRIRTSTTNIQAADAYGAPQFYVEELLDL